MTKNNVWGSKTSKNANIGGGNRRFKPNLQNFQMTISRIVAVRLKQNFNTMFGPWVVHGYETAIQDGGGRHFVFFDKA